MRLILATLAVLGLTACGPVAPSSSPPAVSAAASSSAPTLRVVHTPGILVDDMHLSRCHARVAADGEPLPDPACTPGAVDPAVTQADIHATICLKGYTTTVRPGSSVTGPAKRRSEAQYGIGAGEYDHLVPLELGGASATSNLWPEPGPIPNSKDKVENRLHAEVCAGQLSLSAAQHEIAHNWTTAR